MFQKPRTSEQDASFASSLKIMGDLYASAIGTAVLQLKEIPECPPGYKSALFVGDLLADVDEAKLKDALGAFGSLVEGGCTLHSLGTTRYAIVKFAEHTDAMKAEKADAMGLGLGHFFTLRYNERRYDERGW